jgi:hypothetical protein
MMLRRIPMCGFMVVIGDLMTDVSWSPSKTPRNKLGGRLQILIPIPASTKTAQLGKKD